MSRRRPSSFKDRCFRSLALAVLVACTILLIGVVAHVLAWLVGR